MSEDAIEAKNELEKKLLAAINGELSGEDFMREMMNEQIFIPIKDEADSGIANFQRSTRATPLVVQDEEGRNILILFTSPERAQEFLAEFPGYGGGLLADFAWIVERMEPGFAIVVNPGLELGMDIDPDDVTWMVAHLAEKSRKN